MSTATRTVAVALVLGVAFCADASARQRGGRRSADRAATVYDESKYGIKIPVPPDMELYTPEEPGLYGRIFTERRIAYFVSALRTDETIIVKYSDNMSEADLTSYRAIIETNPPQARLPGFKKLGAGEIAIGTGGGKGAVEFVYTAAQDAKDVTLRQVMFIHNGRGFTVTCQAPAKRFERANRDTFDRFFAKIELR